MNNFEATTFNNPPVREVRLDVQFQNTLEVGDFRSKFHDQVKQNFPLVVMPDLSKLTNDFSDYSLFTEDYAHRLEISINYFRLVSENYPGFTVFSDLFSNSLSTFASCYNIKTFRSFAMRYSNILPLKDFGAFEDCFSIQVSLPTFLQGELIGARGVLMFDYLGDYVTIEIEPKFENDNISSYLLNLVFASQSDLQFAEGDKNINLALSSAHMILGKTFFNVLTDKYLHHLSEL